MRGIVGAAIVGGLLVMAWTAGSKLSGDAVGLAMGVVFGVLASSVGGLLVLAAGRGSGPRVTVIDRGQTQLRQQRDRAMMEAAYWRGVAAGQRLPVADE